eukprot:363446-Chlamydomonas_euryale.AAC.8
MAMWGSPYDQQASASHSPQSEGSKGPFQPPTLPTADTSCNSTAFWDRSRMEYVRSNLTRANESMCPSGGNASNSEVADGSERRCGS